MPDEPRENVAPNVFYLDASLQLPVCQALDLIRPDVQFPGKTGCPISAPNVPDEHWLPIVGDLDWIVVMRDKRIRNRKAERDALMASGVRAFCLTGAGNYSKWDTLSLLVRRWASMEDISAGAGPYIYALTQGGAHKLV